MNKYFTYLAYLGLFAVVLVGCKAGPNYEAPEVQTPEEYVYSDMPLDSNIDLKWWEFFKDPMLDTLVHQALENNKNVLATYQRMEASRAELALQKANLWPKFDVSGNVTGGNYFGGALTTADPLQNIFAGAQVSWEIDFWGKIRRMNESAKAQYLSSAFGLRATQIALISEVTTTYFTLLEFEQRLEIAKVTVALRDSSLQLISARYQSGIIPEIDLNQAEIQYAIAASAIPQYERQIRIIEHSLSVLVGELPHRWETNTTLLDQDTAIDIPTGIPADLIRRRPDVLQAEQNLIAQNALIGVAQAQRLPSISLTGLLGAQGADFSSFGATGAAWSLGGNLLGPIFYFGQNKRRVEAERFRTQAVLHDYENTILNAFADVENSLVEIETYRREVEARAEHVRAALNAQRLSQQRYDKGVTSYLEYLESQRQAFEAQLILTNLKQEYLSSYVRLYKALGGGWITREEFEAAQKAEEERKADENQ
jgi:multidrug efflux system outer membrane protein